MMSRVLSQIPFCHRHHVDDRLLHKTWCLVLLIVNSSSCSALARALELSIRCIPRERDALLIFKAGLTDPGNRLVSWEGEDCYKWSGIRCSNRTGHVVGLDLSAYGGGGSQVMSATLGGEISSSLLALHHLRHLDLSGNSFDGAPIPECIGGMKNLRYLDLGEADFGGMIPRHLGNLSNLVFLGMTSVESFQDRGLYASDLAWLENLSKLQFLQLHGVDLRTTVNWAHGVHNLSSLGYLELQDCGLHGSFPEVIGNMTSLKVLDLAGNYLIGMIPKAFAKLIKLEVLYLGHNDINGDIAELVKRLPVNVQDLELSESNLTGSLPEWFEHVPFAFFMFQNLKFLDLSENKLEGAFPNCRSGSEGFKPAISNYTLSGNPILKNCIPSNTVLLKLNGNKLSGPFPSFLQSCPHIRFLSFAHNKFSGNLPAWIGEKLLSLEFLMSRSNMFSGHIPHQITMIKKLQYFDVACNNISGTIPQSLLNLVAMTSIVIDDLDDPFWIDSIDVLYYSGTTLVVTKGQQLKFSSGIRHMVYIDLSCNNLTGHIPSEIGKLVGLKALNLSWNHLSGTIPDGIGGLKALESFDLSNNRLSGEIPASLSVLTSLTHLNLSYNNLSGRIPSGYQLRTLSNQSSIYMGNRGLCGPPLSNSCSDEELKPESLQEHQDIGDEFSFYMGTGIAYVMSIWVVLCAFLFKTKWRVAWFAFFDGLCDWVYVHIAVSWASLLIKGGRN